MTATRILIFDSYRLEPATFEHKHLAEEWTEADPEHRGKVDPRFWLEQGDGFDSYIVSDLAGPVLFLKVIARQIGYGILLPPGPQHVRKGAELHMQFMPAATEMDHKRISAALLHGSPWLEQILMGAGVEEVYFDSTFPGLIAFTTKRLGYEHEGGRLRKRLPAQASISQ